MEQVQPLSAPAASPLQSDAELCVAAQQGSEKAYAAIIRRHNRRLFRIARSILRNDAEAEDALQEAYVQAFLNLGRLREPARLSPWLGRIAANEALMRLRGQRRTVTLDTIEEKEAHDDGIGIDMLGSVKREDPEARATQHEVRTIMEKAVDRLPPDFRMVFVACAIEQMSIEETAACFDLVPNTVKTRFHRAKRMLREALGAEFAAALPDAFPFAGARCDQMTAQVLARLAAARARARLQS
jgi:RNA polymerase sigma-70 factor (ECF subfamily)